MRHGRGGLREEEEGACSPRRVPTRVPKGMIQRLVMRRSRCSSKPSPGGGRPPKASHPVSRRKLSRDERDDARLSKVSL